MAASRPTRPKPLDWSGPSYLTIFVRNLKLLQLDHRDDWPEITLRGLSSSSANQRQRIRLVEWALYQLFAIWDPEGTQNVLHSSYWTVNWEFTANICIETPSVFPTARTPTIRQPSCSTLPRFNRIEEKWRSGPRDNSTQDNAG